MVSQCRQRISCQVGLPEVVDAFELPPYFQDLRGQAGAQAEQRCSVVRGADWAGAANACIQSSAQARAVRVCTDTSGSNTLELNPPAAQCALFFQLTKSGFQSLNKCCSHQGRPLPLQKPGAALVSAGEGGESTSARHSRCPAAQGPSGAPRTLGGQAEQRGKDAGHLGSGGRGLPLTRRGGRSWVPRRVASWGRRLGTRLRWAQGRGDLRVALALSLAEGRAGRSRQPRAQWGSAGPLASTSWIAARRARRKRPALVVKGFLSEAIRRRLLAAGSPPGARGSRAAPLGPGLGRGVGGAGVENCTYCDCGSQNLTGKSPSRQWAARRSGSTGDRAQRPLGPSSSQGSQGPPSVPKAEHLLHIPDRWPCCLPIDTSSV